MSKVAPIRNYPEYRVTTDGNIIGKRGKKMTGTVDRNGYKNVILSYYPMQKNALVHRLVLETFAPVDDMEYLQVNHKDGNKLNNKLENLEWCTRSENLIHAYKLGLERKMCGEDHHAHKLTWETVKYIREHYIKGDKEFGFTALAKKFNVDRSIVADVVYERTWRKA